MALAIEPTKRTRLGFHYYPDAIHYREQDLQTWGIELQRLGASWLTLHAPLERAIPEFFLTGLLQAGIQPVLHFPMEMGSEVEIGELRPLFQSYARWGVRHVAIFDRPNLRSAWPGAIWSQADLVERFLDRFTPLATVALSEGLAPVFPPLEPGGDYWDLAFLRLALRGLARRDCSRLLDVLVLGLSAWKRDLPLDWGAGGPDRWPGARPYFTPPGVQDHLGFRIFDWYLAVARQELERSLPVIILRAGDFPPPAQRPSVRSEESARPAWGLEMTRLAGDDAKLGNAASLPPEVLACNLWVLAADETSPAFSQAWFKPGGERLAVVDEVRQWAAAQRGLRIAPPGQPVEALPAEPAPSEPPAPQASAQENTEIEAGGTQLAMQEQARQEIEPQSAPQENAGDALADLEKQKVTVARTVPDFQAPSRAGEIAHYVLLPMYAWGAADWDLDLIRPLLQDSHPTIGFSLVEARLARHVTVVGGEQAFSGETLGMLRSAGCQVDRLMADGTFLAT